VYIAHRDNNEKFKERLATVYGVTPEEVCCRGCLSNEPFGYCRVCPIKSCTREKGYESCHRCSEWPCQLIEGFPLPVGKRVIRRAIPQWREMGTENWVAAEEARYICPHCGKRLFRGAKCCRECKEPVDQD
jgi:hypothetical protein